MSKTKTINKKTIDLDENIEEIKEIKTKSKNVKKTHSTKKVEKECESKTKSDSDVESETKSEIEIKTKPKTKKNKSNKKNTKDAKNSDEPLNNNDIELNDDTNANSTKKNAKKNTKKETPIDLSYLRLPENVVEYELKEHDNNKNAEFKNKILSQIDKAHNILYACENIEGEDALNDIMNWIFIKSIQSILSDKEEEGKIDLFNKKYYSEKLFDYEELDRTFDYLRDLKKIANAEMKALRDLNESTDIIRQIGEILRIHPITKMIYTENNFIKARKSTTIQTLLREVIIPLDVKELESSEDVIGEIYEHIINGYVKKGSKLGQFFTPRMLMKLLLHYKEKSIKKIIGKINKDNIIIGDTCMGTGGWIVTAYNMLKEKYSSKILLSGGEVKPSTFQYGLMNLILTIRKFPHDVRCESSLTHINSNKIHFLFTNPPFQTDKKFDQVKSNFESDAYTKKNKIKLNDVYMLKDNNPPIQFLELDYYKLEENGMCMIVLPHGELFFGSNYSKAREHFMKTCNITEIILFPGGIFTHTGIKTCALVFEKDSSGTKEIKYLEANKECNCLTKITSVKIEDIEKEPNKSWYLRDYLKDEYIETLVSELTNYEWVDFGDVFTLEKGKIQSSEVEEDENGKYIILSISEKNKKTNIIDDAKLINGENIFIATTSSGTSSGPFETKIKYFSGECSFTNLISRCVLQNKYTDKINLKFVYYYLKSIQEHIEKTCEKGSCNKSLDIKNFNRMKIPIPTMREQEIIMKNIIFLEYDTEICKTLKSNNEKKRRMYMENMVKGATRRKINKECRLGELITFLPNGKRKSSEGGESGKYPLYYCSINNVLYMDEYDFEGEAITINVTNGSGKCGIFHPKGKYSVAESTLHFCSNDENIISTNYVFNWLLLVKSSVSLLYKGTQQMSLQKLDLENKLKIPIPPMERQQQMQKAFDNFDWFDEYYTNRIKENEEQSKTALYDTLYDIGIPQDFCISKYIAGDIEFENNDTISSETKIKKSKSKDSKLK